MNPSLEYANTEIDVRELVKTVLRGKWTIISATVAWTVLVGVICLLLPKKYEASATLVITQPVMPPKLDYAPVELEANALKSLTLSGDLVLELYSAEAVARLREQGETLVGFTRRLQVEAIGNRQVNLKYTDRNPQRAAAIANLWAGKAATRLNSLFGVDASALQRIQGQFAQAEETWANAEAALLAYLPKTQVDALRVRQAQTQETLAQVLAKVRQIDLLVSDAELMLGNLLKQPEGDRLTLGDALAVVALQQRATGGVSGLQIQSGTPNLLGEQYTVGRATATLRQLGESLKTQRTQLENSRAELEKEVTTLATAYESAVYEVTRLTEQRDRARGAYQGLANQEKEAGIYLAINRPTTKQAVQAVPPARPSFPRPRLYTALAGMVGLILSTFWVLAVHWWRQS